MKAEPPGFCGFGYLMRNLASSSCSGVNLAAPALLPAAAAAALADDWWSMGAVAVQLAATPSTDDCIRASSLAGVVTDGDDDVDDSMNIARLILERENRRGEANTVNTNTMEQSVFSGKAISNYIRVFFSLRFL